MPISHLIAKYDLSRYTVYQMLEYVSATQDRKVVQEERDGMYLIKTTVSVNDLYNYAHILDGKLSTDDNSAMKTFFADDIFRIKFPENESLSQACAGFGYTYRSTSYGMVADIEEETDYSVELSADLKITRVKSTSDFNICKSIFAEAFDYSAEETEKKIGFIEKYVLDEQDNHMSSFILYEKDIPVSTGSYYAFDSFSIEHIGTRKDYRGKGYADKIMKTLLQEAQRLKYKQACLSASEAGYHVYLKVGFKVTNKNTTFFLKK